MSLARAFMTVSGLTMASRVLGLVREMMLAALLGSGPVAQAFFVAFRLPNLFRSLFAEGAFNMAFVPLFAKTLEGGGRDAARDFAETVLSGLLAILLVVTLAAQLAMPWVILAIAYGFADDPEKLGLAIAFAQIQFPYLLFISLTALFSGALNAFGRFAAAAGAPILLNVTMIAGMAAAAALDAPIGYWLSWSVFVAGALQFLFVARAAARAGLPLRLRLPRWTPMLSRVVRLGVPGAIAGGVTQINILIGTTIATFYDGAVVWLALADRVYQLPLGVIGVAIGVALLPELSRRVRAEEMDGAREALNRAIELALIFALPAAAALAVMPEPIVRMLFGLGAYTEADVEATAAALGVFALGVPAYILIKALAPAYFASEDTATPVRFAALAVATNVILSVSLSQAIGWFAIPIATVVAAYLNVLLLWGGLKRRGRLAPDGRLVYRVSGAAAASVAMGAGLSIAIDVLGPVVADPVLRYPSVLGLVAGGAVAYALAALLLGVVRPREARAMLRRRRGDPPPETGLGA